MPSEDINNMVPIVNCHKCGKTKWTFTPEKHTWVCICCGNLIYLSFGKLEQQIDRVLSSQTRYNEFVYSEDETYIKPKKNNTLKRLRYEKKL